MPTWQGQKNKTDVGGCFFKHPRCYYPLNLESQESARTPEHQLWMPAGC
jgi:hypothetical protein